MHQLLTPLLFLLLCTCAPALSSAQEHPFLLTSKSEFADLREKASEPLFAAIKSRADQKWDDNFATGNWYGFAEVLGANALRSVFEEDSLVRAELANQTLVHLRKWVVHKPLMGAGPHLSTVIAATSFMNSVLALDMLHDDFTPEQLAEAETLVGSAAEFFVNDQMRNGRTIPWRLASLGAAAVWEIYRGDPAARDAAVERYRFQLMDVSMTSDGSWVQSPGYWHARMAGDRIAKSHVTDIIQHVGLFDFYGNQQMQNNMVWGNAFSMAPSGQHTRFGETGLIAEYNERSVLHYRMGLYGEKLGNQAAWHLGDDNPHPSARVADFLTYVLTPSQRKFTAEMPKSVTFQNSGGAFWDKVDDSRDALMGVLYNLERENNAEGGFQHASEDMNSIGIFGYGEMLLANAGVNYVPNYPGQTPDGGRWTEAWMQNVVLVNNEDRHLTKDGKGLRIAYGLQDEQGNDLGHGLTGGFVDFAEGFAGQQVLGRGNHERSFFFVQPVAGRANGYFLLNDQVQTSTNTPVSILLHPNTKAGSLETVRAKFEYSAPIDGFLSASADGDERVTIYYGTPPLDVEIKQAWRGAFDQPDFANDYLDLRYSSGSTGWVRAATAIIPEDSEHPKPRLDRLASVNYTGIKITHEGGLTDYFVSSANNGTFEQGATSFRGESIFFRVDGAEPVAYTVATGSSFLSPGGHGFSTNENITIQMDGLEGQLQTDGATVTFHFPGIQSVSLNGELLEAQTATEGSMTVEIPAGQHEVVLTSSSVSVEQLEVAGLSVSPNPFSEEIRLSWETPMAGLTARLIDANGRVVASSGDLSQRTSYRFAGETAGLPAGIYFVQLTAGERAVTRRVVKR